MSIAKTSQAWYILLRVEKGCPLVIVDDWMEDTSMEKQLSKTREDILERINSVYREYGINPAHDYPVDRNENIRDIFDLQMPTAFRPTKLAYSSNSKV